MTLQINEKTNENSDASPEELRMLNGVDYGFFSFDVPFSVRVSKPWYGTSVMGLGTWRPSKSTGKNSKSGPKLNLTVQFGWFGRVYIEAAG